MVNKPKKIGTAAETAIVKYAQANGFPDAERRALHGNNDQGDILLCPGVIIEVKSGQQAETASDQKIEAWLAETYLERSHAGADFGFLVTKRRGKGFTNVGAWNAHTELTELLAWLNVPEITWKSLTRSSTELPLTPLHLRLDDMLRLVETAEKLGNEETKQ